MITFPTASVFESDSIAELIGQTTGLPADAIIPFVDQTTFITELLRIWDQPGVRIVSPGHATPETEITADRAEMELVELLGRSPFYPDLEAVRQSIQSTDILFLSNPNRVTGTAYSISELRELASLVPDGMMLVDEHYFDFYGLSAHSLQKENPHLVILRSFAAAFGIYSSDAGYLVGEHSTVDRIRAALGEISISRTNQKIIRTTMTNGDAMSQRLKEVHDESLSVARQLTKLGVQCKITPTDFLLMRVADTTRVGNFLAQHKSPVENLSGYPSLDHYMRYRVQSPLSNERMLMAFGKMPPEYFRLDTVDRRMVRLRRNVEKTTKTVDNVSIDRTATPVGATVDK